MPDINDNLSSRVRMDEFSPTYAPPADDPNTAQVPGFGPGGGITEPAINSVDQVDVLIAEQEKKLARLQSKKEKVLELIKDDTSSDIGVGVANNRYISMSIKGKGNPTHQRGRLPSVGDGLLYAVIPANANAPHKVPPRTNSTSSQPTYLVSSDEPTYVDTEEVEDAMLPPQPYTPVTPTSVHHLRTRVIAPRTSSFKGKQSVGGPAVPPTTPNTSTIFTTPETPGTPMSPLGRGRTPGDVPAFTVDAHDVEAGPTHAPTRDGASPSPRANIKPCPRPLRRTERALAESRLTRYALWPPVVPLAIIGRMRARGGGVVEEGGWGGA